MITYFLYFYKHCNLYCYFK